MCVRLLLVSKTIGVTSLFKKDVPKKEMSKGDAVWSKKTVLGGGRRAKIALFLESCFRFSSFLIPLSHSLLYVCACCPWRFFPWKARGSFHTHTHIHTRVYGGDPPNRNSFSSGRRPLLYFRTSEQEWNASFFFFFAPSSSSSYGCRRASLFCLFAAMANQWRAVFFYSPSRKIISGRRHRYVSWFFFLSYSWILMEFHPHVVSSFDGIK